MNIFPRLSNVVVPVWPEEAGLLPPLCPLAPLLRQEIIRPLRQPLQSLQSNKFSVEMSFAFLYSPLLKNVTQQSTPWGRNKSIPGIQNNYNNKRRHLVMSSFFFLDIVCKGIELSFISDFYGSSRCAVYRVTIRLLKTLYLGVNPSLIVCLIDCLYLGWLLEFLQQAPGAGAEGGVPGVPVRA